MDSTPDSNDQDPPGINDATPMDTDNQQTTAELFPIGDSNVSTSIESVTGQENCQSTCDTQEDLVDSGQTDTNTELVPEDTNVRVKIIIIININFLK